MATGLVSPSRGAGSPLRPSRINTTAPRATTVTATTAATTNATSATTATTNATSATTTATTSATTATTAQPGSQLRLAKKEVEVEEPNTPSDTQNTQNTPNTPDDTPNTLADIQNTPDDTPNTPGDTPNIPADTQNTPGNTPNTPDNTRNTPDNTQNTRNTPDDTPNALGDTQNTPGDTPNTPGDTPNALGDTPNTPENTRNTRNTPGDTPNTPDTPGVGDPPTPEALSPDDEQLLAKLEEQNRLLESDSRSLSFGGSRRNSGSSLVSSSSASSGLGHMEEDAWSVWGHLVNEWEEVSRKRDKHVKELVRKGIPHHFRGIAWQLLCGAQNLPVKRQYSELLKLTSPCQRLIRRDIARTFPEHELFREKDSMGQEVLFNVMKAYSLVDPEVGYCQGSAFIVGLLLMQMPEEDAFCVFVRLMQGYRLRELFKPSMAELGLCIYQFECMIQETLPDLYTHFQAQSFHTTMYASSWFLTIFLTTFPLPVATRIFDVFVAEGLEVVFRVGMAILQRTQADLMQQDMEGMLQHFQKAIPHMFDSCPEWLMTQAFQVKYNAKRMRKLEREYNTQRSKEIQEQVEMKRLRTENRLLRQRVENLEKEATALVDKLVQGQVCRAQENEEQSLLRRELAQLRHQNREAVARLQEAEGSATHLQEQLEVSRGLRCSEEFVLGLEQQLARSQLREEAVHTALRHVQEHIIEMEQKRCELPEEGSAPRLRSALLTSRGIEAGALQGAQQLRQRLDTLQRHWEAYVASSSSKEGATTAPHHHQPPTTATTATAATTATTTAATTAATTATTPATVEDELMAARIAETRALAELSQTRHRLTELETQSHVTSGELRRMERDLASCRDTERRLQEEGSTLRSQLNRTQRRLTDHQHQGQERAMAARFRGVEEVASTLLLKQRVCQLEMQEEEDRLHGELRGRADSSRVGKLTATVKRLRAEVRRLRATSRGDSGPAGVDNSTVEQEGAAAAAAAASTISSSSSTTSTSSSSSSLNDDEGSSPLSTPPAPPQSTSPTDTPSSAVASGTFRVG